MNHTNIRYIPVEKNHSQKSFLFEAQLAPKHDGNWIAWIGALPGCAAWGWVRLNKRTETAIGYDDSENGRVLCRFSSKKDIDRAPIFLAEKAV